MRTELVYNQKCPFRATLFTFITTHIRGRKTIFHMQHSFRMLYTLHLPKNCSMPEKKLIRPKIWTKWRRYRESATQDAGFQEKDNSIFRENSNRECALTEVNLNVRFVSAGPLLSEYRRLEVGIRK